MPLFSKFEIILKEKAFKNEVNILTIHTDTSLSWKDFMGGFRTQSLNTRRKMWKGPGKAPSRGLGWNSAFTLTDSRNSVSIRVIPLKNFQVAAKLRVQGVGWWSLGLRVDLQAGLTCLFPGTCRAAVWVKPMCPHCPSRRKEHIVHDVLLPRIWGRPQGFP